jgi:hypothetical protein
MKNFGLTGVAKLLKFGRQGLNIDTVDGTFKVTDNSGEMVSVLVPNATAPNAAVNLGQVNSLIVASDETAKIFPQIGTIIQTLTPTVSPQEISWNLGSYVKIDVSGMSENLTLTLADPLNGSSYMVEITQGATARNVLLPSGTKQGGGGGITINGEAGALQLVSLVWNGTFYLATVETYS